jgi:hypothetical protein
MTTHKIAITGFRKATLLLLGAVTAVACESGIPDASTPSTSGSAEASKPSSPSLSSPTGAAMESALAAYRGMWQDFVAAGATSDWQSPKLGQHATGIALTNLSRSLYADHYNGLITKGEPVLNPSASSAEPPNAPTKVIITDCGDSTQWLKYRAGNGHLVDDKPGGRRSINAIVEKQADGSWKVSDYGVHDVGTC